MVQVLTGASEVPIRGIRVVEMTVGVVEGKRHRNRRTLHKSDCLVRCGIYFNLTGMGGQNCDQRSVRWLEWGHGSSFSDRGYRVLNFGTGVRLHGHRPCIMHHALIASLFFLLNSGAGKIFASSFDLIPPGLTPPQPSE